ncbi:hypothetical protein H9P43_005306 [Blastocladiella emersonii ATCC 22665]|nr:hypothetical protein H9P43_005306 [Blastocladiella emersonii ATCC 22665]
MSTGRSGSVLGSTMTSATAAALGSSAAMGQGAAGMLGAGNGSGAYARTTAPLKAQPLILFDVLKREPYSPSTSLKAMQRRLRQSFKIALNKDEISLNRIFEASLLVFCGPREKFSTSEFSALKSYLDIGGSILYLVGEGGEAASGTNFNYLLEEYGMSVNSDSVVRTSYYKYFHPKEAHVANGVLNRELTRVALQSSCNSATPASKPSTASSPTAAAAAAAASEGSLSFVYPFGATINVQKPSVPILSSGSASYPVNRPIGGVYSHPNGKGKLAVVASIDMFADTYIDKEDNAKLFHVLVDWLTSDRVHLNPIDANEPEITDYHYLPDITSLSSHPRACLQDTEDLPRDFTRLFDHALFGLDLSLVPAALTATTDLRLKHEPLTLISPQFESPLPALTPAVFPPMLRELPPPPLELFDLDAHLAPPAARLAQLAAKCSDDDLEYYLREAGAILGVPSSTTASSSRGTGGKDAAAAAAEVGPAAARRVLDVALRQLISWKKLNHGAM